MHRLLRCHSCAVFFTTFCFWGGKLNILFLVFKICRKGTTFF